MKDQMPLVATIVSQWRQNNVKLLWIVTGPGLHLYDIVTIFNSNSNLRWIQIHANCSKFSCTQIDFMFVTTFLLVALCQACVRNILRMHMWSSCHLHLTIKWDMGRWESVNKGLHLKRNKEKFSSHKKHKTWNSFQENWDSLHWEWTPDKLHAFLAHTNLHPRLYLYMHTGLCVICIWFSLPWHVGSSPDHIPESVQTRESVPCNKNPSLHSYIATERYVVLEKITLPFSGGSKSMQSTTIPRRNRTKVCWGWVKHITQLQ